MEVAVIAAAEANWINQRVEESESGVVIGDVLLVGEREIAGPSRSSIAGAASFVVRTAAVIAENVVEVRFRGNVWNIANA